MTFSTSALRQSSASKIAANLIDRLFTTRPGRRAYVDVRDLPDHLKRDLGFLDGKEPSGSIC